MRKKLPKKLLFLVLFLFFVFKGNAQYATSHYIAPSPWQYWSNANEIVLTTESTTTVTVTLKKSDGTLLATRTLTSAAPNVYRFAGSPWLLNSNPVNTIQDDRGLIVECTGGKVSVNLRNVASDQASSGGGDTDGKTIKGNASLVSFGNEGRGTAFRLGYYRSNFAGIAGFNGAANLPVYSVMAIDDNTQVKLNGANLVLLNKGQSYLFQPTGTGDLLEANKPVVANTGAYTDTPGGCGDGAVDQMAPVSILGTKYIVVRGSGTAGTGANLPEQSTIIASEENTQVTVTNYAPNGAFINTTTFTLASGGSYHSIHHGDANNRYSSSIIESNKPIAVYSGTAQSCEVDIATVLPVGGCSGSKWTSTSQFKGYKEQVLPYFGFVLVESLTAIVYVNGTNIESTTGNLRFQLGTTGVYLIRFENTQIGNPANITVTSSARMNVGIVQQGGGFSMSGFFSSFNETPALPEVTKDSNGCAINIITADPGLEPYQWYFEGVLIPGATSQSIIPEKTGNYSITGTRDCGVTGKSAAIYVAVCGDREVTKTVANGSAANEVVFTVAAKNNGPNEDRNVVVTDALPSGYTFVSASPSTGTYDQSTGIWNIGNLAVNAAAALNIIATIKTIGGVTNTASIKGDNIDLTLTNDSDNATPQAELKLVKTARTGVFNKAGDVITYDLVVTNTGKVPVFNINITDANADSGSISPASVATLLPGASANSTATHTVTLADLIASKVINSAEAKGVDGSNNPVEDISGSATDNDTETETETKSVIFADNDTVNAINGNTGATNVINIFANDNINGNSFVPADVVVTLGTSGVPAGLTLNTDGSVDVAAGTAAGTYTFDYKICQVDIPLNCADATVTVIVTTIDATNDTPSPINGTTGGTIPTVFGNDTLDGVAFLPTDVTLTTSTTLPTGLTLNSDGTITVDANTAPGTYPITYSICQVANPLICDTATTTVIVNTIDATNDTPSPINGTTGGTTPTVFANDTLDGVAFLPADVTLTTSTALPTGLTLNSDGTITVDANTSPGTYPVAYSICQVANPLICDTATTTVIVTTIDATNDTPNPINGTTGGTIPTVFANDTLDGVAFLPADVTLTTSTTLPTGLTLNSDGTITVDANTSPGTYPVTYSICQVANPLICDTATTTVIVTRINATNDTPNPINGTTGGTTPTVFGNDTLDGVTFLPTDVTLTTSTVLPTGLTLNSDGTITVDANTAPGTYPITYSICQVANPLICDTATTTVIVTTIDATNDTPNPINGTTGGTIPTVFANDTLDGVAFLPTDVTLTTSTVLPTGLTLNSDGTITVDANTAPGTYPITYSICQVANPLICDTATTTVIVTTINADNDTPSPINGTTGGTIPTIFENDTLDGVTFLPTDVTLTTSTVLPTGLTLNSDGTITVDANTAPGSYPITYSICQVANPLICDTATTTVVVTTINADNDTQSPINGTTGGTIPTVFGNDTMDGATFLPTDVTLTTSTTLPTGLTLNSDGTITVDANTAPGTYPITYSICQVANLLICDTATTTVIVTTIDATNDTPNPINGTTGGTIPTVFGNDTLDGVAFLPIDVTLTTSTVLPTGLTLNSDGTITVNANTAPGTYPITYSICQVANPLICDTATTTVVVTTINADNDTPSPINGTTGGTIPTVFGNDTLDGVAFLPTDVTLTTSTVLPTGLTLNSDGTITVDANTAPGTYPVTYSICQVANPLICDTATIDVIVQVPTIEVIKKGTFNDANGDGFAQKGETITYNFSVVNTGTMQLTNVVVTDPMVTVTGGPIAVLNVGTKDDTTFSATYVITQADVDAGAINNQALVTATPIVGTPISNLSDSNDPALPGKNDSTITKLSQNPGLKLLKHGIFEDANHDGSVSEGDRINYVFRVINTGNVTIKDIVVTDPMVTVTGGPISLEPLAFDTTTFTASYVLTQSDIDLGAVYNLALVTGNDPNRVSIDNDSEDISPLTPQDKFYEPACPTCTVTTLEQKSGIALVKTAVFNDENNNKNAEAGETITYSFVVTNTGNVRLTNVVINDPLPGIVMTGGPISLSPGESDNISFKGIYALKQSDINTGKVSNQAFVTAKNPLGVTVSDASDDNDNSGNNPTVSQIEGCVIKIFNAMSPNGDTKNERFYIQGLECYPDNTVEIYNRWGVLVFERENYNNEERAFRGMSEGRTTVKQSDGLPVGTYYYILKYKDSDSNAHQEAGYLYLSK
ncbi:DUF7507 domain-containing protein [Flavobacterium piscisymbiosum]|uniref:DUF11 domain-containing protein n=1 Tax=Flavobacterium piscisymbiosum TaxID=2893753 RepID=A0ABS8MIP4_9FLAO|nr:gliding motility-associated C-terminal domain-containing protein [Flavobacterium sp. F-30]MCC9065368.1 DUF11 domain-containing protein [Flavobacterium sp. F-30]